MYLCSLQPLDDADDVTNRVRPAFFVCAAGAKKNAVDGIIFFRRAGDKSVLDLLQPAGAGLALGCGWTNVDTLPRIRSVRDGRESWWLMEDPESPTKRQVSCHFR